MRDGCLEGRLANAGECGGLKECTSRVGGVIIESEGDSRCNPGALGIKEMVITEGAKD